VVSCRCLCACCVYQALKYSQWASHKLVETNSGFIKKIVKRYHYLDADATDLFQEGKTAAASSDTCFNFASLGGFPLLRFLLTPPPSPLPSPLPFFSVPSRRAGVLKVGEPRATPVPHEQ
jgi:hypothetical protein